MNSSNVTALLEMDTDPFFPAPYDVTPAAAVVALDPQGELLGKPQRGVGFNRRPGFGQVANDAGNAGRAKFDCASQQHPMPG